MESRFSTKCAMSSARLDQSELTPRNDEKDCKVILCNRMLNSYARTQENIYMVDHSNLRDPYSKFRDETYKER